VGAGAIGSPRPTAIGTSVRPHASSTLATLLFATSTGPLPHTVVSAHHSAAASSTPPSVSMIIGMRATTAS
jgi:hypothetical protein